MKTAAYFTEARRSFHAALLGSVLSINSDGVASNADKDSRISVEIARRIVDKVGSDAQGARLAAQMSGNKFEVVVEEFLKSVFPKLKHLRPGTWQIRRVTGRGDKGSVANFEQFAHLAALKRAARKDLELAAALGTEYMISPDVIITRIPEEDSAINQQENLIDESCVLHASLRKRNNQLPLLHASISCKWTLRSDRAQNARAEALNLMRNRKGKLPHVVVVTGEPSPARIASLALGTGDIDCTYHFALPELVEAVRECNGQDEIEYLLKTMIEGKRLRDISDLPLDLAV